MKITVNNLFKRYGENHVLRNISMTLNRGELVSIIGPSGVGKSTLLRILAGLEQGDGGEINYLPSIDSWRPIIMVFQDFMLFPHITVQKNITYGLESPQFYSRLFPYKRSWWRFLLKQRKKKRQNIQLLTEQYIEQFGLQGLERKYPAQLSAGQKQRVALARAMIIRPSLLLLDEPFANLDPNLKMETALFIRKMQHNFGVSILAVTHDLQEAFAMSNRIGVMLNGKILQMSDVETLYRFPINAAVGSFLGPINVLPAQIWEFCDFAGRRPDDNDGSSQAGQGIADDLNLQSPDMVPVGDMWVDYENTSSSESILVRAESIELISDMKGNAVLKNKRFQGTFIYLEVELRGVSLVAYSLSCDLSLGQKVQIRIRDFVFL